MQLAPMSYHYVRYPIEKFLDKVERSPFDSIDLYCSAPQLNMFDYPVSRLLELDKSIRRHHLSVMAMTPENCVYPVNFCTQDTLTRESSIRYYQRAIDTAQFLECRARKPGNSAGRVWGLWLPTPSARGLLCCWRS